MFLMELEMVSWYSKYPREALLKVSSKSNIRKGETSRAGMLLMEVEIGLEYSKYPYEALLKVSSISNIRKFVKTPPILQLYSWTLEG